MSAWYETDDSDIEIDYMKKEVNIYVTFDDFGTIYKTLSFSQIEAIWQRINVEPIMVNLPFDPANPPKNIPSKVTSIRDEPEDD